MVVLRIDDDRVNADHVARPDDSTDCIQEQGFAKPASLVPLVDRQAPDYDRWHWIVREATRQLRRQSVLLEASRAERVVADDLSGDIPCRNEDLSDPTPGILGGLLTDVVVQCRIST